MKIFSIILLIILIPCIYFILDKKLAAFFIKKFKINEIKNEYIGYINSGANYTIFLGVMILGPVYFIKRFGSTFNLTYVLGFAGMMLLAILLGTLERIFYLKY